MVVFMYSLKKSPSGNGLGKQGALMEAALRLLFKDLVSQDGHSRPSRGKRRYQLIGTRDREIGSVIARWYSGLGVARASISYRLVGISWLRYP